MIFHTSPETAKSPEQRVMAVEDCSPPRSTLEPAAYTYIPQPVLSEQQRLAAYYGVPSLLPRATDNNASALTWTADGLQIAPASSSSNRKSGSGGRRDHSDEPQTSYESAPPTLVVDGSTVVLTELSLLALKVRSLKTIAQQLDLKTSGKKADLVYRILEHSGAVNPLASAATTTVQPLSNDALHKPKKSSNSTAKSHCVSSGSIVAATEHANGFYPFHPTHPTARVPLRNCLCGGSTPFWPGPTIACRLCNTRLHAVCMKWTASSSGTSTESDMEFLCPACRLHKMDPFLAPVKLLWFSYLHPGQPGVSVVTTRDGDTTCIMGSTGILAAVDLHAWRRRNYEVVVRCVRLGTPTVPSKLLQHTWPRTLDLRLHNAVESVLAPRQDHPRRDAPLTITHYLKPGDNMLECVASELLSPGSAEGADSYGLGVFLCAAKTVSDLVNDVQASRVETFEEHRQRVIRIVESNVSDDDVACIETNRKMKLTCPVTLTRINLAVRGRQCPHLQCFDLESFVTVTKASKAFNNRWRCPICNLVLHPEELVVDQFVSRILSATSLMRPVPDVVEVDATGAWKVVSVVTGSGEEEEEEAEQEHDLATMKHDEDEAQGFALKPPATAVAMSPWGMPVTVEDIDDTEPESAPVSRKRGPETTLEASPSLATAKRSCFAPADIIDLSPSSASTEEIYEAREDAACELSSSCPADTSQYDRQRNDSDDSHPSSDTADAARRTSRNDCPAPFSCPREKTAVKADVIRPQNGDRLQQQGTAAGAAATEDADSSQAFAERAARLLLSQYSKAPTESDHDVASASTVSWDLAGFLQDVMSASLFEATDNCGTHGRASVRDTSCPSPDQAPVSAPPVGAFGSSSTVHNGPTPSAPLKAARFEPLPVPTQSVLSHPSSPIEPLPCRPSRSTAQKSVPTAMRGLSDASAESLGLNAADKFIPIAVAPRQTSETALDADPLATAAALLSLLEGAVVTHQQSDTVTSQDHPVMTFPESPPKTHEPAETLPPLPSEEHWSPPVVTRASSKEPCPWNTPALLPSPSLVSQGHPSRPSMMVPVAEPRITTCRNC